MLRLRAELHPQSPVHAWHSPRGRGSRCVPTARFRRLGPNEWGTQQLSQEGVDVGIASADDVQRFGNTSHGSFAAGQSGPCSLDLGETVAATRRRGLWVAARTQGCHRVQFHGDESQRRRHRAGTRWPLPGPSLQGADRGVASRPDGPAAPRGNPTWLPPTNPAADAGEHGVKRPRQG